MATNNQDWIDCIFNAGLSNWNQYLGDLKSFQDENAEYLMCPNEGSEWGEKEFKFEKIEGGTNYFTTREISISQGSSWAYKISKSKGFAKIEVIISTNQMLMIFPPVTNKENLLLFSIC